MTTMAERTIGSLGVGSIPELDKLGGFFGPAKSTIEPQYYDKLTVTNWDLPDAYKGKNIFIEDRIIGLIVELATWYTSEIFPYIRTDQFNIKWNTWDFGAQMAQNRAYEGTSRLLKNSKIEHSETLEQKGIAFQMELLHLTSDEGEMIYLKNLENIQAAVQERQNYDTMLTLLSCKSYNRMWEQLFGTRADNLTVEELLDSQAQKYFCGVREEGRLGILIEDSKSVMQKYSPDALIVYPGAKIHFTMEFPTIETQRQTIGQNDVDLNEKKRPASLATYHGLQVYETKAFDVEGSGDIRQLLIRTRMVGEYYKSTFDIESVTNYQTRMRDIAVYDENRDTFVKLRFKDALPHAGIFDEEKSEVDGVGEDGHPKSSYSPSMHTLLKLYKNRRSTVDDKDFFKNGNVKGMTIGSSKKMTYPQHFFITSEKIHSGETVFKFVNYFGEFLQTFVKFEEYEKMAKTMMNYLKTKDLTKINSIIEDVRKTPKSWDALSLEEQSLIESLAKSLFSLAPKSLVFRDRDSGKYYDGNAAGKRLYEGLFLDVEQKSIKRNSRDGLSQQIYDYFKLNPGYIALKQDGPNFIAGLAKFFRDSKKAFDSSTADAMLKNSDGELIDEGKRELEGKEPTDFVFPDKPSKDNNETQIPFIASKLLRIKNQNSKKSKLFSNDNNESSEDEFKSSKKRSKSSKSKSKISKKSIGNQIKDSKQEEEEGEDTNAYQYLTDSYYHNVMAIEKTSGTQLKKLLLHFIFSCPCNRLSFWNAFIKEDIYTPFNVLYFRPFITHNAQSVIMLKKGVGNNYIGHPNFILGSDAQTKMVHGHFTLNTAAICKIPDAVYVIEDVVPKNYLGGRNTAYATEPEDLELANQVQKWGNNFSSVIVAVVSPSEKDFKKNVSVTGKINVGLTSSNDREGYYDYSTAEHTMIRFDMDSTKWGDRNSFNQDNCFLDTAREVNLNNITRPGLCFSYSPESNLLSAMTPSQSFLGNECSQTGAAAVLDGKAKALPRFDPKMITIS